MSNTPKGHVMDKFKSLVHLVIADCDNPAKLGAIRLNKILWFSDMEAYLQTGNSISGTKYLRRKKGPVPAHILQSLKELESENKINIEEPADKYTPRKYTSLTDPDLNMFSDFEQDIVKDIAKNICNNFSADQISELSHDDVWEAAGEGENIPLSATLISYSGDYRSEITNWADSVVDNR